MSFLVTKVAWVRVPSHSSFFLPFLAVSNATGAVGYLAQRPRQVARAEKHLIMALMAVIIAIRKVKLHFNAGFRRVKLEVVFVFFDFHLQSSAHCYYI
jgi:hypothetical protein